VELTADFAKNPITDRDHEAGVLGHFQKIVGRNQAVLGVLPAEQHFEANDLLGVELQDRLIEETKLLLVECGAERAFETKTAFGAGCMVSSKTSQRAPPRALARRTAMSASCRRSSARGEGETLSAMPMLAVLVSCEPSRSKGVAASAACMRLATRMASLGSEVPSRTMANSSPPKRERTDSGDGEFWFGDGSCIRAGYGIFATQGAEQADGGIAKDAISGGRPERAVEIFEAIEIEEEERVVVRGIALGAGKGVLEAIEKEATVGQSGQDIVEERLRSSCCSACLRSVMSRLTITSFWTSPASSRMVLAVDSRMRQRPSLWRMRYSIFWPMPVRRASRAASSTRKRSSG
jgi:hypothetical protein